MSRPRSLLAAVAVVLLTALGSATGVLGMPGVARLSEAVPQADGNPIPFLAYYYIWFDRSSWDRAKRDLPLLGPYFSDDPNVARQHIRWAKAAGITGFIVSWKSTPTLDRRLELLIQVATEENFKLAIIYQGLDFDRRPLPPARVAADLRLFQQQFASDPVFRIFEKPLVIFSGTWEYSDTEVESVTADLRADLLILASEKNVNGFKRIQHLVDGDAYYWSSVNPDTYPRYQDKLDEMAAAVHDSGGLWIAPAAPGYNATLLGGTVVVDRQDGDTLRRQVRAAVLSAPDAVGLISWNEFSENSHVEPSRQYGDRYLKVLSQLNHIPPPVVDLSGSTGDELGGGSSAPDGPAADAGRLVGLALIVAAIALTPVAVMRRARRARRLS